MARRARRRPTGGARKVAALAKPRARRSNGKADAGQEALDAAAVKRALRRRAAHVAAPLPLPTDDDDDDDGGTPPPNRELRAPSILLSDGDSLPLIDRRASAAAAASPPVQRAPSFKSAPSFKIGAAAVLAGGRVASTEEKKGRKRASVIVSGAVATRSAALAESAAGALSRSVLTQAVDGRKNVAVPFGAATTGGGGGGGGAQGVTAAFTAGLVGA